MTSICRTGPTPRRPGAGRRPCLRAGSPDPEKGRRASFGFDYFDTPTLILPASGEVSSTSPLIPPPAGRSVSRAALFGLDYLAARVVAAVRADRMRPLRLLAVRTRLDLHERQRKVRAPAALLRLG